MLHTSYPSRPCLGGFITGCCYCCCHKIVYKTQRKGNIRQQNIVIDFALSDCVGTLGDYIEEKYERGWGKVEGLSYPVILNSSLSMHLMYIERGKARQNGSAVALSKPRPRNAIWSPEPCSFTPYDHFLHHQNIFATIYPW